MRRGTALWIVVALLGIVVAAGVMAAASRLSSQHVGLSSEPLSAGDRLAPESNRTPRTGTKKPARSAPARPRGSRTTPAPSGAGSGNAPSGTTTTTTTSPPTTTTTRPTDDSGGHPDDSGGTRRGSGDGGGGDD